MPEKMITLRPWPMPSSVISSPSQMANIVPAVMVMIVERVTNGLLPKPATICSPPARLVKMLICPQDCNAAIGIAR